MFSSWPFVLPCVFRASVHNGRHQSCEQDILKMNEPILMRIILYWYCIFSVLVAHVGEINFIIQVVYEARAWNAINFWVRYVKGQGHTRTQFDLAAWRIISLDAVSLSRFSSLTKCDQNVHCTCHTTHADDVCMITEERPTVTIDHERVSVTEGSSVTINCVATGVPTPVIRWTKSYEPLPSHHRVGICSLTYPIATSTIQIHFFVFSFFFFFLSSSSSSFPSDCYSCSCRIILFLKWWKIAVLLERLVLFTTGWSIREKELCRRLELKRHKKTERKRGS